MVTGPELAGLRVEVSRSRRGSERPASIAVVREGTLADGSVLSVGPRLRAWGVRSNRVLLIAGDSLNASREDVIDRKRAERLLYSGIPNDQGVLSAHLLAKHLERIGADDLHPRPANQNSGQTIGKADAVSRRRSQASCRSSERSCVNAASLVVQQSCASPSATHCLQWWHSCARIGQF